MLTFFSNTTARIRREEKGATAVEYGIMVALIAVVIIVAVTLLGGNLTDMFGEVACEKLQNPAGVWNATTNVCGAAGS